MGNNVTFLLSSVPWRSKLARWIKPAPASLRFLMLVLLGSFFGSAPAQASNVVLPASGSRVPFAIDDFDGDGIPNLAIIQLGSNSSSGPSLSSYKVQVQLGDGGLRSIDLLAPSGGLRIAARDVNGDGAPDIIVSLAWEDRRIAVLLNDGRANFSVTDPTSFPCASGGKGNTLNGFSPGRADTVARRPQSPVGDFSGSQYLLHPRPAAGSISLANSASFLSALLVSLPGRAPPQPSLL